MEGSKKIYIFWILISGFAFLFLSPETAAESIPTIEDLTRGKVKIGETIDNKNVDRIKDYLSSGVYECVQKGKILTMGNNLPPEELVPRFFWEATERNKGKATIDKNRTVFLKDGSPWPGGLPFVEPKNGLEVMANQKYGHGNDDAFVTNYLVHYINKKGKIYKTSNMEIFIAYPTGRLKIPPIGAVPGMENINFRHIAGFTYPLEMKGLGQLTIRYYDDNKDPDAGFVYLPAFKRTIRISATTYQDNMGGQDLTWGDPEGLREPFRYWRFKLLERKHMLIPEPCGDPDGGPYTAVSTEGIDSNIKFDLGSKFVRLGWAATPVHVVEATPKIKHIYGKKILYIYAPPYWTSSMPIVLTDIYDRQGKLWKCYIDHKRDLQVIDGESYCSASGFTMHDLQKGHTSRHWYTYKLQYGLKPESITLKKLFEMGR